MTLTKTLASYGLLSVFIAVVVKPGYDMFSGIVILLSGTLGSLKLCIESYQDIYYETIDAGTQFNSEAFTISLFALIIWVLGGVILFLAVKSKWKRSVLFGTIAIWIIGSAYNICWFSVRSL